MAPMTSADFGGSEKRGGASSSGALRTSRTPWQKSRPSAVRTRAATRWWIRASAPRWAATVPAAEPIRAPTLHMPCRLDMMERPSRVSVSTPSAFIATSDMPAVAPYTKSAPHSPQTFGASEGRIRESVHRTSRPRSAVRAPKRWETAPARGMASEAPSAGKASASPSCPALTPACSWIQGMRVAKLPVTAPWTQKTAATAKRARRRRSVVTVSAAMGPPGVVIVRMSWCAAVVTCRPRDAPPS